MRIVMFYYCRFSRGSGRSSEDIRGIYVLIDISSPTPLYFSVLTEIMV